MAQKEVLDAHPKADVTLVHGGAALLDPRYPAKLSKSLLSMLNKAGVKVLLGQKIDVAGVSGKQEGVKTFTLADGKMVEGGHGHAG